MYLEQSIATNGNDEATLDKTDSSEFDLHQWQLALNAFVSP